MTTITWLHISDLHRGAHGKIRWPGGKSKVLEDMRQQRAKFGPPDLLLFTGDLAYSGESDQYREVDEILDEIFDAVEAKPILLPVPGNHDMQRPTGNPVERLLANYLNDSKAREYFKKDVKETVHAIDERFCEYRRWLFRRAIAQWDDHRLQFHLGRLTGDYLLSYEKDGFRLGLAGLNSAFLDISKDAKVYAVEPEQLEIPRLEIDKWSGGQHACLLMTHHPPEDLETAVLTELIDDIYRPGAFAAWLCGHRHAHEPEPAKSVLKLKLQVSSLFGLDEYGTPEEKRRMGYAWGVLNVDDSPRAKLTIFCREELKRGDDCLHEDPKQPDDPFVLDLRKPAKSHPRIAVVACTTTFRDERDHVAAALWERSSNECRALPAETATQSELDSFQLWVVLFGPGCVLSDDTKSLIKSERKLLRLIPSETDPTKDNSDFLSLLDSRSYTKFEKSEQAAEYATRFRNDWDREQGSQPNVVSVVAMEEELTDAELLADLEFTKGRRQLRAGKSLDAVHTFKELLERIRRGKGGAE